MTDLLDSVLEDIRQQKLNNLFKRYGKCVILIVICFVLLSLILNWWQSHQDNIIHHEAAEYVKTNHYLNNVSSQQMLQEGIARMEKLSQGKTIYATLAKINLANIYDAMGNFNKSAHFYSEIGNDSAVDASLRSFADLMKISSNIKAHKITHNEALEALKAGTIFEYSGQLLKASVLLESGKKEEARALLDNMRVTAAEEHQNGLTELLISLTVH